MCVWFRDVELRAPACAWYKSWPLIQWSSGKGWSGQHIDPQQVKGPQRYNDKGLEHGLNAQQTVKRTCAMTHFTILLETMYHVSQRSSLIRALLYSFAQRLSRKIFSSCSGYVCVLFSKADDPGPTVVTTKCWADLHTHTNKDTNCSCPPPHQMSRIRTMCVQANGMWGQMKGNKGTYRSVSHLMHAPLLRMHFILLYTLNTLHSSGEYCTFYSFLFIS